MYTVTVIRQEVDFKTPCNNIKLTIYNKSTTDFTPTRSIIFKLNENKQWTSSPFYIKAELIEYLIENKYIKPIKNKNILELNNSVLLQVL
jgi:hypothetical protein